MHIGTAVSKSGTGTWGLGCGTWYLGLWGLRGTGTWDASTCGDSRTWDIGTGGRDKQTSHDSP